MLNISNSKFLNNSIYSSVFSNLSRNYVDIFLNKLLVTVFHITSQYQISNAN